MPQDQERHSGLDNSLASRPLASAHPTATTGIVDGRQTEVAIGRRLLGSMSHRKQRPLNRRRSVSIFNQEIVPVFASNPARLPSASAPRRTADRVAIFGETCGRRFARITRCQLMERDSIVAHLLHDFPQHKPGFPLPRFRQLFVQRFLLRLQASYFRTLISHDLLEKAPCEATVEIETCILRYAESGRAARLLASGKESRRYAHAVGIKR